MRKKAAGGLLGFDAVLHDLWELQHIQDLGVGPDAAEMQSGKHCACGFKGNLHAL
jgi:hypothetical protein